MTIYWSNAQRAFFDDRVHGARSLLVTDRDALTASLRTADLLDQAAFEDACGAAQKDDAPSPDRATFTVNRDALIAQPPLKLVENPDCKLPGDAVEITPELHTALIEGQAAGKAIDVGVAGAPELIERSVDQVAAVRARRTAALKASDWTQLADAGLSAATKKAWAAHRKRLRDLPALVARAIAEGRNPAEIEFPEAPG